MPVDLRNLREGLQVALALSGCLDLIDVRELIGTELQQVVIKLDREAGGLTAKSEESADPTFAIERQWHQVIDDLLGAPQSEILEENSQGFLRAAQEKVQNEERFQSSDEGTLFFNIVLDCLVACQLILNNLLGLQNRDLQMLKSRLNQKGNSPSLNKKLSKSRISGDQTKNVKTLDTGVSGFLSISVLQHVASTSSVIKMMFCTCVPLIMRLYKKCHRSLLPVETIIESVPTPEQQLLLSGASRGRLPDNFDSGSFKICCSLAQLGMALLCDDNSQTQVRSNALAGMKLLVAESLVDSNLLVLGLRRSGVDGRSIPRVITSNGGRQQVSKVKKKKPMGFRSSSHPIPQSLPGVKRPPANSSEEVQIELLTGSELLDHRQSSPELPAKRVCKTCSVSVTYNRQAQTTQDQNHCIACGFQQPPQQPTESPFHGDISITSTQIDWISFVLDSITSFNSPFSEWIKAQLLPKLISDIAKDSKLNVHKSGQEQPGHCESQQQALLNWSLPIHGWLLRRLDDQEDEMIRSRSLEVLQEVMKGRDAKSSEVKFIAHLPVLTTILDDSLMVRLTAIDTIIAMSQMTPLKDGAVKKISRIIQQPSMREFVLLNFIPHCKFSDANALRALAKYISAINFLPKETDKVTITKSSEQGLPECLLHLTFFHSNKKVFEISPELRYVAGVLRSCCLVGEKHAFLLDSLIESQALRKVEADSPVFESHSLEPSDPNRDLETMSLLVMIFSCGMKPGLVCHRGWNAKIEATCETERELILIPCHGQ